MTEVVPNQAYDAWNVKFIVCKGTKSEREWGDAAKKSDKKNLN